jgi:hypothetical protein
MANQIKTSFKYELWRDSVNVRNAPLKTVSIDTTSELMLENTQIVGTSHELLAANDVTDDAVLIVENIHATATIEIGGDSTGSFVSWFTIPPGYPIAVFPVVSSLAATYLRSDTASTPIKITLVKIVEPA